jgi:hypothetical protein
MSGEWRYYYIDVAAETPPNFTTWVMTNVSWQDPDTNVDVMVYITGYGSRGWFEQGWEDSTYEHIDEGHWVGSPTGLNPPQNVLLQDWTWDSYWSSATDRGYLMIVLHVSAYGGHLIPEEVTITVAPVDNDTLGGFSPIPSPTGNIVVNSGSKHVDDPVVEDAIFEGPHAMVTGTLNPYTLPGFPSISIKQTDLQFRFANETIFHGWFVESNATRGTNLYGPPWDAMFELSGIVAGMPLSLDLRWHSSPHSGGADLDLFLLAPNGDLFAGIQAFGNYEFIGIFAPVNGTYIIGVDYYGDYWFHYWDPQRDFIYYEIQCTATAIHSHIGEGLTVTADTADLDLNLNLDLVLRGITGTSLDMGRGFWFPLNLQWRNVRFINFFAPTLTLLNPTAGDLRGPGPFAINWTASDMNLDETLSFQVEMSNNGGVNWSLIVAETTESSTTWDPTGFHGMLGSDMMMVRVTVTDGMYTVTKTSGVFTVLTPTHLPPPPPNPYLIIGAALIIVEIVVIIYLVKRRQTTSKKTSKAELT